MIFCILNSVTINLQSTMEQKDCNNELSSDDETNQVFYNALDTDEEELDEESSFPSGSKVNPSQVSSNSDDSDEDEANKAQSEDLESEDVFFVKEEAESNEEPDSGEEFTLDSDEYQNDDSDNSDSDTEAKKLTEGRSKTVDVGKKRKKHKAVTKKQTSKKKKPYEGDSSEDSDSDTDNEKQTEKRSKTEDVGKKRKKSEAVTKKQFSKKKKKPQVQDTRTEAEIQKEIEEREKEMKSLQEKYIKILIKCTEKKCQQIFKDQLQMEVHVRKEHLGLPPYHCNICKKDCKGLRQLRKHLPSHNDFIFKCPHHPTCTKAFKSKPLLNRHVKKVHSAKVYSQVCPICSKGYDTRQELETHFMIHNGENPFKCEDCSEVFNTTSKLAKHVKTFHQDPHQFKCTVSNCTRSFATKQNLKRHQKLIHTDVYGSLKCPYCEETFLKEFELRKHREVHFPKKVHQCNQCGKSYKSYPGLNSHMYSHRGEKPYKCKLCDYAVAHAQLLSVHEKKHHSGI